MEHHGSITCKILICVEHRSTYHVTRQCMAWMCYLHFSVSSCFNLSSFCRLESSQPSSLTRIKGFLVIIQPHQHRHQQQCPACQLRQFGIHFATLTSFNLLFNLMIYMTCGPVAVQCAPLKTLYSLVYKYSYSFIFNLFLLLAFINVLHAYHSCIL